MQMHERLVRKIVCKFYMYSRKSIANNRHAVRSTRLLQLDMHLDQ